MPSIGDTFDDIARDAEANHKAAADEVVDELKYKVSVPVQYVTGSRGGRRVIRSKPGEPPRKETGTLQGSIQAETAAPADVIETAITADAPYATRLQEELNRPITDGEESLVERKFADALAQAING